MTAVQLDVQRHFPLQVLAVISIVDALAGLYLSLLYYDSLSTVIASYALTLNWVEVSIACTAI
jgi:hypothetical protein